jgi:hypothetical protein
MNIIVDIQVKVFPLTEFIITGPVNISPAHAHIHDSTIPEGIVYLQHFFYL